MLRRVYFNLLCLVIGLSILLILTGNRCSNDTVHSSFRLPHRTLGTYQETEDGEYILLQRLQRHLENGSPNINEIIEKTRFKIKLELLNYNFTHSDVHKLEDLLIESGGRPVRTVVISAWRSGSTFFGELLNAMPSNFYHYEPLLKYQIKQIRGPPYAEEAASFLKSMLRCDYNNMEDYFEYGKTHLEYLNQFKHNTRLWDQCQHKNELCFDPNFTGKFCKLFPFHSMKLVRFRLHLVEDILQDQELNVKVVLLIRDPRGVMQSRRFRNYCRPAPDCSNPELVCADMISDYKAAGRLHKKYPDRFMVLRYEDLALNLNTTTLQLLKFLRLGATQSIDEFLHTHTNVNVGGKDSTFRVTRNVPFKWKNILEYDYVETIQEACKEAMELWGYKRAYNASHMASENFYPLLPYFVTH